MSTASHEAAARGVPGPRHIGYNEGIPIAAIRRRLPVDLAVQLNWERAS